MSDPFLGQVEIFAFNFPPRNWMQCAGQILGIGTHQALFSLLGTTYGGNGQTTFALPDLRSRVAVGVGRDSRQVDWTQGQAGGEELAPLTSFQIAAHTHDVMAASSTNVTSDTQYPSATVGLGQTDGLDDQGKTMPVAAYVADAKPAAALHVSAVSPGTGGQPHENRMPLLVLNPCICINGSFPSRG